MHACICLFFCLGDGCTSIHLHFAASVGSLHLVYTCEAAVVPSGSDSMWRSDIYMHAVQRRTYIYTYIYRLGQVHSAHKARRKFLKMELTPWHCSSGMSSQVYMVGSVQSHFIYTLFCRMSHQLLRNNSGHTPVTRWRPCLELCNCNSSDSSHTKLAQCPRMLFQEALSRYRLSSCLYCGWLSAAAAQTRDITQLQTGIRGLHLVNQLGAADFSHAGVEALRSRRRTCCSSRSSAAGVTPGMRCAAAMVVGRAAPSFSRSSADSCTAS